MAHKLAQVMPEYVVWPGFIAYILIVSYSMTSLITGVISESLVSARMSDEKLRMSEVEEARAELFDNLAKVLKTLDRDGNGLISSDELKMVIEAHPEILTQLGALDIVLEAEDFIALFNKVSKSKKKDEDDAITIDAFVDGLSHLTGPAKASALFDLKTDLEDRAREANEQSARIMEDFTKVETRLDKVEQQNQQMESHMANLNVKVDKIIGMLSVGKAVQ
eukprot:gnl/TRDRNA2_/TRDRNA2_157106_c2_seq1.p1 gnl/TRDRNA2_/TRDRNA2_157106_c2~~gnl/TRDRNA2_/TRDRNA2_157106_c2_seq1.p1  ORF type:complete len:258 (+),score=54.02 gnl/TRDRNA2_/TRDRNA2_157106_c2_seq1:114-776(+)